MSKKATSNDEGKPSLVFSLPVLRAALAFVGQAIAKNPIVPVLENVKIYAIDGKATFTGSDLQSTLTIDVDCDIIKGGTDGDLLLIPYQLLSQTVATLTTPNLVLHIDTDRYGHTLKAGNGTYKMAGENPVDYPKTPTLLKPVELVLTDAFPDGLALALTNTVYMVSKDDFRPASTGVSMRFTPEELALAATNFHAVVRNKLNTSGLGFPDRLDVILPAPIARMLSKMIDDRPQGTAVTVRVSSANVSVMAGAKTITGRLIDAKFPDVENAIPTANNKTLVVNRVALMEVLKRILLFANRTTHQIRLSLASTGLQISAEDLDYSNEGSDSIACQYTGEAMEIGFDAKLLLTALSHIDAEEIEMHGSEPNRAMLIYRKTDDGADTNSLTLVAPMMLNTYV